MKPRTTPFTPSLPRAALAALVALLRADTAKARRLGEDVAAWQAAAAPRLLQADPALGFDLALVRGVPGTPPGQPPVGPLAGLARRADGRVLPVSLHGADLSPAADAVLVRRLSADARRASERRRPLFDAADPAEAALTLPALDWVDRRTDADRKGRFPEPPGPGALNEAWRRAVLARALGPVGGTLCLPHAATLRFSPAHEYRDDTDDLSVWPVGQTSGWIVASVPAGDPRAEALRALDERVIAAGKPFTLPGGLRFDPAIVLRMADSLLRAALKEADLEALARANRAFLARLDQTLIGAMAITGNAARGVALHNWLLATDDARRGTLRRQALEAYPLLLGSPRRPDALDDAIDGAATLEERLAAAYDIPAPAYDIPAPAVRALQGVRADAVRAAGTDPDWLLEILPQLKGLPPGHWPARGGDRPPLDEQWAGLGLTHQAAARLIRSSAWQDAIVLGSVADALGREKPVWRAPGGLAQCRALCAGAILARDTADAFSTAVLMPLAIDALRAAGQEPGYDNATKLVHDAGPTDAPQASALSLAFVRDRPIGRLIALAEHHHANLERIDAEIVARTDPRDWPPLTEPYRYLSGGDALEVVPLTTAGQLAYEGAGQGHCVASYVTACMYQRCHILSIRRPDGTVLSTAEIRLDEPAADGAAPAVMVRQHHGPKNGEAPPAAAAALASYLEAIADGYLLPDWGGLEAAWRERVATRPASASDLAEIIGYDPADPAARDAALQAWAFVLPRDERGLSHAVWAERLGLPDLLLARAAAQTVRPAPWGRVA